MTTAMPFLFNLHSLVKPKSDRGYGIKSNITANHRIKYNSCKKNTKQ